MSMGGSVVALIGSQVMSRLPLRDPQGHWRLRGPAGLIEERFKVPLEIEEVDCNLEDMDTARALVDSLDSFFREKKD